MQNPGIRHKCIEFSSFRQEISTFICLLDISQPHIGLYFGMVVNKSTLFGQYPLVSSFVLIDSVYLLPMSGTGTAGQMHNSISFTQTFLIDPEQFSGFITKPKDPACLLIYSRYLFITSQMRITGKDIAELFSTCIKEIKQVVVGNTPDVSLLAFYNLLNTIVFKAGIVRRI